MLNPECDTISLISTNIQIKLIVFTKEKRNIPHNMLLYFLIANSLLTQITKPFYFAIYCSERLKTSLMQIILPETGKTLPRLSLILFFISSVIAFFALNINKGTLKLCSNAMPSQKFKRISVLQSR